MSRLFQFDGYTLRPTTEDDLPMAVAWNAADPDHAWELERERFWIENAGPVETFLLESNGLGPVFFLRTCRLKENGAIEITIQFNREEAVTPLWNTMSGMQAGMKWLERILPGNGIDTIYFSSKSARLIQFATRRLGFTEVENLTVGAKMDFRRFRKVIQ
jgi:hypothetical protein